MKEYIKPEVVYINLVAQDVVTVGDDLDPTLGYESNPFD